MGDIPPNPTHHPLPPNPSLSDTAGNRSPARQMDPPQEGRPGDPRDEFPRGFTRGGFAPIPQRHADMPPAPAQEYQRERSPPPPPRNYDRDFERDREPPRRAEGRDRSFPRRDLDPEPDMERGSRSWDTYYERTGRGGPPPREEDAYDYGRPKRRRSPSPYDSAARVRYRSPTPPPRFPTTAPAHNFPDPAEVDYVLTFRQFSEWFRASHPQTAKTDDEETRRVKAEIEAGTAQDGGKEKVGMAKRYDRYRKEYLSRQLYAMYLTHGQTAWFKERYSNEARYETMRKRLHRQGRVPTVERYIAQVREGKWDDVCYDVSEYYKKNGNPSEQKPETDLPEGMDQPLGEHSSLDPVPRVEAPPEGKQVFVKTVPPSTERLDLEEVFTKVDGFVHLAITEPHIKKSFHRVAWAQFTDEADLDDVLRKINNFRIDTFTFHLGINSTSVIGRMKFAASVASTKDRQLYDAENAKALAIRLEEDLVLPPQDEETNGESKPDTSVDKPVKALEERGSHVVEETISRLLEKQGLDGEDLTEEQIVAKARLVLDQWLSYLRNGLSTCYYCVAPTDFPEELQRKCIAHMRRDTERSKTVENSNVDGDRVDEDAEGRYDDREGHTQEYSHSTRRQNFPQRSADEKWEANLDARIKPLLGPVDVVEYGGKDLQEESKKVAAPHIRQEEATKYRCKECNKLFKAPEFVVKHVIVKHPDLIGDQLDNIPVFNNYVLDPQHAHPQANAPAAINDALPLNALDPTIGHINPNMAGGDMSGGSLMMQQQMMMMLQMQQAMMMGQMQFPQQQAAQEGMGPGGQDLLNRVGGYASRDADLGPLPAAPAGGEDPRAKRGRVSYQDLDEPGGAGDGGLPY